MPPPSHDRSPGHNIVALLRDAALRFGRRLALAMESAGRVHKISYAQLWERVDRVGTGLAAAGLKPGDRAVLMVPMSIDLYVAMLAVLKAGAVGVFVDPWVGAKQIAAFAAFAEPAAFFSVATGHLLRWLQPRLRKIPLTVTAGRRCFGLVARHRLADLAVAPDGLIAAVRPDDPALITFTSGSSGVPKGANRTHGFLLAQHNALAAEFPYRDDDIDMPMFPVFALNNLAQGLPSVIPAMDFRRVADVDADRIVEQMRHYGVTTCTASPPFFDRLASVVRSAPHRRPRLRRILTGGAPVTDDQLRAWRVALPDTEIVVVYGSTEAEPVAHIHAEERLAATSDVRPDLPGYCVGRPQAVATKVVRIDRGPIELSPEGWPGWEVPPGDVGELVVSAPHVCTSYYNNPDAVAENNIRDDAGAIWHRMGDTGYFDGQGRFWLVGRVHSTIFRQGLPVHPQLVEQACLAGESRLQQVAAMGLPDEALGQRLAVVAVPRPGVSCDGLAAGLRRKLQSASIPCDEVILRSSPLPVDPRHNSKIDYADLRAQLMTRATASP